MSNINGNGTSDWNAYQRLVLAELERHNGLIDQTNRKLEDINLKLALMQQNIDQLKLLSNERALVLDKLDKRVGAVERTDDIEDAVDKYKKWIIGILFAIFTAIIVPLIKIFFFGG